MDAPNRLGGEGVTPDCGGEPAWPAAPPEAAGLTYEENNPATPPCKSTASPAATWKVQVSVTPLVDCLSPVAVAHGNSVPSSVPSSLLWTYVRSVMVPASTMMRRLHRPTPRDSSIALNWLARRP